MSASALRQLLVLLAIAAIPSAAALWFDFQWKTAGEFAEFKPDRMHPDAQGCIWIDVRSRERFEAAHIPVAIHFEETLPAASMESIRSRLGRGEKIVVYGEGPGSDRALSAARLLKKDVPAKTVLLLQGGWAGWPGSKTAQ